MKNLFAMTSNVEKFSTLAKSLETKDQGVDGMGLVYGPPGIGKTGSAIWYADKTDAVYFRVKAHTRLKDLLEGLAQELGQVPARRVSGIYNQVCAALNEFPRLVIVDEIDYLTDSLKSIHTIRDLADETAAPFLLIGMMDAERKLMKLQHLYDRLQAHILHLKPLALPDVKRFCELVSEINLDDSAVARIAQVSGGKLRKIFIEICRAERIARANNLQTVKREAP